jgi:hypothetical protein
MFDIGVCTDNGVLPGWFLGTLDEASLDVADIGLALQATALLSTSNLEVAMQYLC